MFNHSTHFKGNTAAKKPWAAPLITVIGTSIENQEVVLAGCKTALLGASANSAKNSCSRIAPGNVCFGCNSTTAS
ncbi:MAG: hypothetical protein HGA97_03265 [Chlorobiaceae bacterium]|nr:hypothetical protein [Chlorobiaceae bacterium]